MTIISFELRSQGKSREWVKDMAPMVDLQDSIDKKYKHSFSLYLNKTSNTSRTNATDRSYVNYDMPGFDVQYAFTLPGKKKPFKRRKENVFSCGVKYRSGNVDLYSLDAGLITAYRGYFQMAYINFGYTRLHTLFDYPKLKFGWGINFAQMIHDKGTIVYKDNWAGYKVVSKSTPRQICNWNPMGLSCQISHRFNLSKKNMGDIGFKQYVESRDFWALPVNFTSSVFVSFIY